MSRLQRSSLRAVLIFILSLSLIDSPMSSLRQGRAVSHPPQSPASSYNATRSNVVAAAMFFRRIIAWFQGGPNLQTMRLNSPQLPNAYQQTGSLPEPAYEDPRPANTANFGSYLAQMSLRSNATGIAGSQPMQLADPTAGASAVGGFSYNLDSRNFNFTFPALSLPGRAGTGVSLFLSSDSKLWTADPNAGVMVFNADKGFPAPGWRLGFGAILVKTQAAPTYSNSVTGKASLIYMSPDGARHDLAFNTTTGAYESYDSTYLRFELATRILRMPNGAQVHFSADSFANGDARFLPTLIKDRNGNFINIYYRTLSNNAVVLDYVIDTAGRRVDFNYQNNRLTSISQNRNGNTFYFVRIDYTPVTIQSKFNLAVTDPVNINGSQVFLPSRITYPTGVNFRIIYTNYGQILSVVKWVPTISGQGGERFIAQTSLNLPPCVDPNAPQGSPNYCEPQGQSPYFPSRLEWAQNWQGEQSQTYSYFYDNPTGQHEIVDPTARRFRVNRTGMVQSVAVLSPDGSEQFKKDEMTYISDSGVSYLSNLRVSQSKTTDDMDHVRVTNFSYLQRDGVWLIENKDERDGAGALLRRTASTYTSYPSQYILGLPQQVSVHDGALTLVSRVTNNYDQTGTFVDSNSQTASYFIDASGDGVIQRDDANFGAGLTTRGNVTSVTQSKVEGGAVTGSRVIKRVSFDTNGNVRAVTDGAGNRSQFQFGDYCVNKPGGVGQTHVVAHTAADPTGFRKGSQWDYFTGLTVKSFNLAPGSSTETQIVTTSYDFADRPLQTTRPDGGWVKTAFWDNWLATVTSQLVETGKTRYKFEEYDGAGRVRRNATDHPDGVDGKFSGQVFVFNKMGQTEDSSNVVAINGSWVPSYEDAGAGFLFTHLTRDDLSRLKVVTFPDNNTRQFEYAGCGCAGSSETRVTDEMGHSTITKTDALGRLVEAIEPPSVGEGYYSKANYFYDAMDRLIRIESYGVYNPSTGLTQTQTRYFTYDGYGRLAQENTPEGGVVNYAYTANDLPLTKTDARNITTTFIYNTRNLVTSVGYSDSTPGVSFTYDDFGARQTMTDGEGSMSYIYNGFRQLESETRLFTALTGKQHTLNYTYNLADQPKSVNYVVSQSSGYLNRPEPVEPWRDVSTQVATLTRPDIPTAEAAIETTGKRSVESFDGARAFVSASALIPGQRARWRPSSAEATSPRVVKTAMRRVVPPSAAQEPTISGRVATSQGAGIQGVNITVTGSPFGPNSAVTDSNGDYTVTQLLSGYNYTATPSKAGYTFNPPNRVYNQLNEVVTGADFTGAPVTYAISGRVTNSQGTGISQVTVTLSGTQGGTTTTNSAGDFSFTNLTAGGNYTVTPSKTGYSFTPTNRSYTNLSANVTNANFAIAPLPPPPFTAYNKTVNYAYNSVGALDGVGTNMIGSDPNATTNVLDELEFRASGAIKSLRYGNGRRLTMGYNANRNQPISMKVDRVNNPSDKIIDYVYDYYDAQGKNNKRIRKITDNIDSAFTTDYTYDNYNRLTVASAVAYSRTYQYDRWGNITD
ncbi:MAG TPA: carboxypeptidase-like regulatory domain-containing protein, partial [Blastocatellia bacterium]|nr:carboxypeptidase-like regulatory domain-containing protein [Blastocatellia bacterium]